MITGTPKCPAMAALIPASGISWPLSRISANDDEEMVWDLPGAVGDQPTAGDQVPAQTANPGEPERGYPAVTVVQPAESDGAGEGGPLFPLAGNSPPYVAPPGPGAHPELPWIELAEQGVEVCVVPGNHLTMDRSEHLPVLAERLSAVLSRVRPASYSFQEKNFPEVEPS